MRNTFILSVLLICNLIAGAQSFSLNEGQSALVYSLPKTKLCIEVEVEKTTRKPGVFYRYSERYLATTNVITAEKTEYRLKSVKVNPVAVPDSTRTYKIVPAKNTQLSHLVVNADGILCGVNVLNNQEKKMIINKTMLKNDGLLNNLLPLGEEYMMAGSEAKLAEGAAKQIYRIRESRLSLLTADVEKLPADGASMKSMLEGLDKMERQLTELFVGTTSSDIQVRKICLTPTAAVSGDVLFRLSALQGVVAADDLSGAPFYISIKPEKVAVTPADPKASKPEAVGLYYVLPASTEVSIGDGINTVYKNDIYMPQFGKTVPLPESLFKQKELKVRIDSQTGRLLGME